MSYFMLVIAVFAVNALGADRPEWQDENGKTIYFPSIKVSAKASETASTALLSSALRVKMKTPDHTGEVLEFDAVTPTNCKVGTKSIENRHVSFRINEKLVKNKEMFSAKEGEVMDIQVEISVDAGIGSEKGSVLCSYGSIGYTWNHMAHIPLAMDVRGEVQ